MITEHHEWIAEDFSIFRYLQFFKYKSSKLFEMNAYKFTKLIVSITFIPALSVEPEWSRSATAPPILLTLPAGTEGFIWPSVYL